MRANGGELVEEHRARLRAVAYRMLGLLSEPGGAIQEAWLRLNRTHASAVENLGGRLTAVVGRTPAMPLPWGRCA